MEKNAKVWLGQRKNRVRSKSSLRMRQHQALYVGESQIQTFVKLRVYPEGQERKKTLE